MRRRGGGLFELSKSRAATTYGWTGDGVNANWSTFGNWGLATLTTPQAGDEADFTDGALRATSNVDANLSVGTLTITGQESTNTDYVLTGSSTTLTVTNLFEVGGGPCFPTISSGLTVNAQTVLVAPTSALTISGGGKLSSGSFEIADPGTPAGVFIGNGGTLSLTAKALVANGGIELDSGGALNMSSGAVLMLENSPSELSLQTSWAIPAGATVQATTAADIFGTNAFSVGAANTGTLLVDGSGSSATIGGTGATFSDWGTTSGNATVTFAESATGNYKSGLHIANAGGTAHVNIDANAQLTISNGLLVGGGATSAATLTLNSATLTIASGGSANFGSGSTFNFQSGTVQLGGNATFSSGSTFNWSGGTFTGTGNTIGINGGGASLTLGGIGINGNTLSITNGGHFDSTSWVDVGTINSSSGTMLVSGTNSRITSATAFSDWGLNPGSAATITFSSSGVGTYSSGVHMATNGGSATLNINSGAVLNVAQTFLTSAVAAGSAATITLNNGTINSTGTTQFLTGTTFNASNISGLNLGGNATFSTGSSVSLDNGFISLPSGKTLTIDGGAVTDTRGALVGDGETWIIQNGGHWDATQEDLEGGTLTVTGSGSRFTTSSSTTTSIWSGPGSTSAS